MNISVVVIGRNVENKLKMPHWVSLKSNPLINEIIYVDSNSGDRSRFIATKLGYTVFLISDDMNASPAAGRYVGTIVSKNEYILYLDADMEYNGLTEIEKFIKNNKDDNCVGMVGRTVDIYADGSQRVRKVFQKHNNKALRFGGCVLLKKTEVLEAGNWNPGVISNEEIELYARLQKNNKYVIYNKDVICLHYTDTVSKMQTLRSVYFPISYREKKFYGTFGYAFAAAVKSGSIWHLLKLNPDPIVVLLVFIANVLVISLSVNQWTILLLINIISVLVILKKRSFLFLFVLPGLIIQIPFGIFKYRVIKPLYTKTNTQQNQSHPIR